ncbi:hypothetical protein M430DRAFT_32791 [Amorphotheca resinae ATCC 22711]|jgi:dihydrofolate reductase|uniref:dihydrofolate reductase n=1 Tax=Amorphotheca resinae ATCC 22711 TaxID=857342 RepID=A0A2T3BG89_AMORE|nr:hypothetical protein M430DRAFT_32791 [Amorphotheca resinae ATCC 22711]PSS28411.1 hypothetical protein M430DRAFT_32791 [Amorphotheca resinae ATCC 22711]
MPFIEDSIPVNLRALDPNMSPRDLTLIVAATNSMGIGRSGTLPWTGLRNEMAYFARVTKRANAGVR